jgi:hypothetical protein
MGGGLMQLVAYGAQDIYLTGNPQITFFKVVYRRHTNFSMESIQQTFNGTADFGSSATATISRNGDLVYRMYLEHTADIKSADGSDDVAVGCDYGSHLMKEMELEIGGQRIDRHYGHWHSVYSQLTEFNPSGSNTTLFNRMTGNGIGNTNAHGVNGWTFADEGDGSNATGKFWIPLYFWFCRNPGLALPLIALQYHEVKVKLTFETIANLAIENHDADSSNFVTGTQAGATAGTDNDFKLWADYIYLDTDERRRFAQVSHEYLIEQLQFENKSGGTMELNFNHPVKELIWAGVRSTTPATAAALNDATDLFQRPKLSNAVTDTFQLKLNGHDRFKERDSRYFTRTQIWQHHTGYGDTQTSTGAAVTNTIAVYSFALKPEEHQPSGTCNFSRIDNAQLVQSGTAQSINVYAVNYNVLRIMSGMGGLAYSN